MQPGFGPPVGLSEPLLQNAMTPIKTGHDFPADPRCLLPLLGGGAAGTGLGMLAWGAVEGASQELMEKQGFSSLAPCCC